MTLPFRCLRQVEHGWELSMDEMDEEAEANFKWSFDLVV